MKIFVFAAAMVLGAGVANAGEHACKADHEKFCKDVKPGEGRIAACMKSHEAELSAACKSNIAERAAHAKELAGACKDDREKLCPGVQPGEGRIAACFEDNAAKLSAGCKAKLATHGKHLKEMRKACEGDLKSKCASVKGHGAKFQCLQQNIDTVSPECKAELDDVE